MKNVISKIAGSIAVIGAILIVISQFFSEIGYYIFNDYSSVNAVKSEVLQEQAQRAAVPVNCFMDTRHYSSIFFIIFQLSIYMLQELQR